MMIRPLARRRRGAVLAETAVVYPAFLMLVLAGLSLGMGLYRHQELAHLARESARWASLQDATMRPPALILSNVVQPKAVCINPGAVTISTSPSQADMATVTLTYSWTPEVYFGTITLRSTARARIAY